MHARVCRPMTGQDAACTSVMITNEHFKPPPITAPSHLVTPANFSDSNALRQRVGSCTILPLAIQPTPRS
jgi:hypothetical protein